MTKKQKEEAEWEIIENLAQFILKLEVKYRCQIAFNIDEIIFN